MTKFGKGSMRWAMMLVLVGCGSVVGWSNEAPQPIDLSPMGYPPSHPSSPSRDGGEVGGSTDLSAAVDLAVVVDAAIADLRVPRDQSLPRDLSLPQDFSTPRDFSLPQDLSPAEDLSTTNHMPSVSGGFRTSGYGFNWQVCRAHYSDPDGDALSCYFSGTCELANCDPLSAAMKGAADVICSCRVPASSVYAGQCKTVFTCTDPRGASGSTTFVLAAQ